MKKPAALLLSALILLQPLLAACGGSPTAPAPSSTATAELVQAPPTATNRPTVAPTLLPTATARPTTTSAPEPSPTPEPSLASAAHFEPGPCPFDLPAGQVEGDTIDCGALVVPEHRSDPAGPSLRLAVALLHSGDAPEGDPIIYLEGGPGGSALELLFLTFGQQFEPLLAANRDLILFDQRGVGLSEPALDCPEVWSLNLELLDEEIDGQRVGEEEALDLFKEATLACRSDLARTADLSAYNTETSAADVDDLRRALGYDQVNLWGVSYGTWLALEVMRRYPEGIRSVVLDSVYPPDRDLLAEAPLNAARAIDLLFESCAASPACNSAYPDLRSTFEDTVQRLNAEPATFEAIQPLTGDRYAVLITGDNLVQLLFQLLYASSLIPSLPEILSDAGQGSYTTLARVFGSLLLSGEAVSSGQQFAVLCRDEIAFSSADEFVDQLAEQPELAHIFDDSILGDLGVELCADWQVGQADESLTQPVVSDIPTLILAGEFDPITPPEWGRHVATTLPNSTFVEYPGLGHGASALPGCPQQMMVEFLNDPDQTPGDACLTGMAGWDFVVPGTLPAEVEWLPFTNEAMGIRGWVPQGWTEAQMGVYARGASATDAVALLQQGVPGTAQDLLNLLTQQLALPGVPEAAGQREANGLTWTLYAVEVQSLSVDFALADANGLALVVLLQSESGERDALYESVYLLAIDALVPIP